MEQLPRPLCSGDQNPEVFKPTLLLKFLYHCFSNRLFRLQIDVKMEIHHSLRRGWPDGRNFRCADLARIVVEFEKDSEKSIDTVRAGENNPVIRMRILHQLGKFAKITGRLDPDRWQLDDVRAQSAQL